MLSNVQADVPHIQLPTHDNKAVVLAKSEEVNEHTNGQACVCLMCFQCACITSTPTFIVVCM